MDILIRLSEYLGILGAAVIVYGVARGLVRFASAEVDSLRGRETASARHRLRDLVAYYLLLGLEFLIAADIVKSIISPTTEELLKLAIIVGIRTVISFSLHWEMGQQAEREGERSDP